MLNVVLIGCGAIGTSILKRTTNWEHLCITHVVVPEDSLDETQSVLGARAQAVSAVPADAELVLECAGHQGLVEHVLPALSRGVECAILSVGALSSPDLYLQLQDAAQKGGTQLHLLAGAIGGIDAIAAAHLSVIDEVVYTGRKPPLSWLHTPAEDQFDLAAVSEPTIILEASAREASAIYPKNANVAATLSIAGLGLDNTSVKLVADPTIDENIHEYEIRGDFGEMRVSMRGKPLPENPKTSALTVLSALRFLHNRTAAITV